LVNVIDEDFAASLKVYPNPSTGQVTLDLGEAYPDVRIIVRNSLGQISQTYFSDRASMINLELGDYAGIYVIEIRTSNNDYAILKVMRK
jgi:hypothetical protein